MPIKIIINIDKGVNAAKLDTVDWNIYLIPLKLNKETELTLTGENVCVTLLTV